MIKAGDELTIDMELISIGGQVILSEGQKVVVREAIIQKGHYSWICSDIWYDDELLWVQEQFGKIYKNLLKLRKIYI